jgi:hypothetical protein
MRSGVGEQRHTPRQHLLGFEPTAPAVDVEGERYVSKLSEGVSAAALEVAQA